MKSYLMYETKTNLESENLPFIQPEWNVNVHNRRT